MSKLRGHLPVMLALFFLAAPKLLSQEPPPDVASGVAQDPPEAPGEPPGHRTVGDTQRVPGGTTSQAARVFDGARAYAHLGELCQLGSRMSGTVGMQRQQQMLKSHFEKLGGRVTMQPFRGARDPRTRRPVPMANLIVEWQAAARSRILLCAHYDTRPRPDQDPDPVQRERGLFVGANDGASGVALLMELGRCLQGSQRGVDFVFFDGEEYKWDLGPDGYFLGSTHFARNYRAKPPAHRYTAGVLLDMVGDARLSVYQELHSVSWSDTRPIVEQLWATARELGIGEFVPDVGYQVRDDHLPLRQIGRIPVCDLIDFHYPDRTNRYWHTTSDVPANCSAESLGKVGLVVHTWLQRQ